MFEQLNQINSIPKPFEYYTVKELWTHPQTSKKMLEYHLDGTVDISSRKFSFIDKSVNWIESYFHLTPETTIADFGCGPGLYASRLAAKGAGVTGIDFSENSLSYAKQKARELSLTINYIHQNYLEYTTENKFDLIIMIMCDFCALSPYQRQGLLKKFHRFLNPKGQVLLDGYTFQAFGKKEECASYSKSTSKGFWSEKPYYEFFNVFSYEEEKVTVDKITIIEESKSYTIYNWLQYFSKDSLGKEFEEAGFQVKEYFADVAGTPFSSETDEFAIVAMKK